MILHENRALLTASVLITVSTIIHFLNDVFIRLHSLILKALSVASKKVRADDALIRSSRRLLNECVEGQK